MSEAIILAGGLGTRLRPTIGDLPKPMAAVAGRPFLSYLLDYLESQGIRRVILSVGYRFEVITSFFGHQYGSIRITYAVEDEPLGTGGAIANALAFAESPSVFVLNGDTFLKLDYCAMARLAVDDASQSFRLAVALREVEDTGRYGRAILSGRHVQGFESLGTKEPGLINAGVYLMSTRLFADFPVPRRFSFEREFIETHVAEVRPLAFPCNAPFIDIGVPEALASAQTLLPAWIAT